MSLRLGIDVGGTNTDAVLVTADDEVVATTKQPTTDDVVGGVRAALAAVLRDQPVGRVRLAMLGTTQCTNAIVQRRGLGRVAVLRLAAPATTAVPPLVDWPDDLVAAVLADAAIVRGGVHVDGRAIAPLDRDRVAALASGWRSADLAGVAITSVFAPVAAEQEEEAAAIVAEHVDVPISLSHRIGSLGLLERENATVLNAALVPVADRATRAFAAALAGAGIDADAYLSQNDGTLLTFEHAAANPVLTIGSGPTNSLRGGGWLAGRRDAVVIDVGGTTADLGVLASGFPRESAAAVEVGGVRTNFRMPDLISVGLGGGTIVRGDGDVRLGPDSVGHRIRGEALCFGGSTTTMTDVAVALGHRLGDPGRVRDRLDRSVAERARDAAADLLTRSLERIKATREAVTVVAVGGGAFLVPADLAGAVTVDRPAHAEVANAVGAALAEVSGETDRVHDLAGRDRHEVLAEAQAEARRRAVAAGADAERVRDVDVEEIALAYLPGDAVRIRARAVGPLASAVGAGGAP